jgi:hypothetical protein
MQGMITRLNFQHLKNELHAELHGTVAGLLAQFSPDALGVGQEYEIYRPLCDEEICLFDTMKKDGYTDEIEEQNNRREAVLRGFISAVKSAEIHFNKNKREAAERVLLVLDSYGNITDKSPDQETADIEALLDELYYDDYDTIRTEIDLNDWLAQLDAENQEFKAMLFALNSETPERPTPNMKPVRAQVDKAFTDIVCRVETLSELNGVAGYEPFIIELNAVLDRYRNIIVRQKREKKTDD